MNWDVETQLNNNKGWLGGAIVLGDFGCRGVLLILIIIGQGASVLAGVRLGLYGFSFYRVSLLFFFLPLSRRWPDID